MHRVTAVLTTGLLALGLTSCAAAAPPPPTSSPTPTVDVAGAKNAYLHYITVYNRVGATDPSDPSDVLGLTTSPQLEYDQSTFDMFADKGWLVTSGSKVTLISVASAQPTVVTLDVCLDLRGVRVMAAGGAEVELPAGELQALTVTVASVEGRWLTQSVRERTGRPSC
ncbi:hypothetical protein [Microbacterium gorillae]|uniref:hypothetical protein n=1 Tax=Microbacterium gorillae TaxID=1231063 RepID=UPI001145172F|nr:hypothetical protein [Microbacterium gorillae]